MKINENDLKYMISECVRHILQEGWRPIYRKISDGDEDYYDYDGDYWDGNDDDEEVDEDYKYRKERIDNNDFDAYVVIDDSDGSVLNTYVTNDMDTAEVYDEAYEDAKQRSLKNKNGTYSVFGCFDGSYDDDTLIETFYMGKTK